MKKTKGFIGLVILSVLAMIYRLHQVFFQKVSSLHLRQTGDREIDQLLLDSQEFALNQVEFYQNNINKWLTILLVLLLIGIFFFYSKNRISQAKWLYLTYIVGQFLHSIYKFVGFKEIAISVNIEEVRQFTIAAANFKFYGSLVLFVVYTSILLISLYRDMDRSERDPV